jgi:hypothetical protein
MRGTTLLASQRTVNDLGPISFPFLPPSKRALTHWTNFGWQLVFGARCSPIVGGVRFLIHQTVSKSLVNAELDSRDSILIVDINRLFGLRNRQSPNAPLSNRVSNMLSTRGCRNGFLKLLDASGANAERKLLSTSQGTFTESDKHQSLCTNRTQSVRIAVLRGSST